MKVDQAVKLMGDDAFFLELFSGSGALSRWMRRRGYAALEWDIDRGAEWDLLSRKVQRKVRGLILAGRVWGVHIGIPCGTFSRARDRGPLKPPGGAGWPSRLRSNAEPQGLSALRNPSDIAAVKAGNALCSFVGSIIDICNLHGIPVSVENPQSSRLWMMRPMRKLQT